MRSSKIVLVFAVLVLGLNSGAWAATALRPGGGWVEVGPAAFVERLGSFLKALWEKSGCRIDPWGGCSTGEGETLPPGDAFEPEAVWEGAGCRIDPLGGCSTASDVDSTVSAWDEVGCKIDPWGGS
jgi:hypothetical protein